MELILFVVKIGVFEKVIFEFKFEGWLGKKVEKDVLEEEKVC